MRSLLEDWQEFERNVLGSDFGRDQRRTAMFAFYTAAATVADRLIECRQGNALDDFMLQLKIECQEIANSIARISLAGPGG